MWKALGYDEHSCIQLLTEMRAWKRQSPPYHLSYNKEKENPTMWWLSINTDKNNDQLQELALHLYAISPSQAACERNFSTLKWIYGDYRTKLSIYKVEAMCKIHSYYISNLDKELKYYGKGLNINEIRNNIFDSSITNNFFDERDFNNINDIENDENQNINIDSNLELGNLINLSLPEFNSNFRSDIINEQSESLRNINVGNMSYDPSALVESIMNQDDLENN